MFAWIFGSNVHGNVAYRALKKQGRYLRRLGAIQISQTLCVCSQWLHWVSNKLFHQHWILFCAAGWSMCLSLLTSRFEHDEAWKSSKYDLHHYVCRILTCILHGILQSLWREFLTFSLLYASVMKCRMNCCRLPVHVPVPLNGCWGKASSWVAKQGYPGVTEVRCYLAICSSWIWVRSCSDSENNWLMNNQVLPWALHNKASTRTTW